MLKVAVSGFCGKMGRRIAFLAESDPEIELTAAFEKKSHTNIDKDIGTLLGLCEKKIHLSSSDNEKMLSEADVLIDFTSSDALFVNLEACLKENTGIVVGTTGLTKEHIEKIKSASLKIPVIYSSNMSIGVNLLFDMVKFLTEKIYKDADIEIIEIHHKFKKDSPSGTAVTIAEIISEVKNKKLEEIAVYGRKGHTEQRTREEIGIHALRICDVVGEHTVVFGLNGERLELTHKAHTRDIFAYGALKAAKFLKGKKNGMFNMQDVLK